MTRFSPTGGATATNEAKTRTRLRKIRIACVIAFLALVIGIWAHFPYLSDEYSRLNFWKLAGLLFGDVAGFLWFARFATVHAVMGKPLISLPTKTANRRLLFIGLAITVALVIDLSFSLYLMHDEATGYEHGKVTDATILSNEIHKHEKTEWYKLECRFQDERGFAHETHVRIWAPQHIFPSDMSVMAEQLVASGKTGGHIRIRYDLSFPKRAWADGAYRGDDANSIFWFSLFTLFLQTGFSGAFLLFLYVESKGGTWPWWAEFYNVVPFGFETFWMILSGLLARLMDSLP